jgi:hypothetical protein
VRRPISGVVGVVAAAVGAVVGVPASGMVVVGVVVCVEFGRIHLPAVVGFSASSVTLPESVVGAVPAVLA